MKDKNEARLRRSRQTRHKISELKVVRLSVHRSNSHIYAQVIDPSGDKVLASASTLEPEVRNSIKYGGNVKAACGKGEAARHRKGCLRSRRLPLPRPRQGAGGSRARTRTQVLVRKRYGETAGKQDVRRRATWRRPARENDRNQPRHQGGEGWPRDGFRGAGGGRCR